MMFGLLLDSSNSALAVGLSQDGKLLDEIQYSANQRQSELMVDEIAKILEKNNVSKEDIGFVAVTKGPGSYTGVRIALTIAKTVVFALNVPLYLVSSLEVMKDEDRPTICISNARSKRSYVGVYQGETTIREDGIMDNPALLEYIAEHPDYVLSGDLGYLGLEGKSVDVLTNLAKSNAERNLVEPLGAKPVYLKDSSGSSTMKIIVREMISADMSQVMDVEKECFPNDSYTEEQFKYELHENPFGHILVATVDSLVVGFVDFMVTFDSSTINQIAVKESFRKKGVGTRLMGKLVEFLKSQPDEVSFLTLEVRKSNTNAQRFYKKHAFEVIQEKKAYYNDGEDAIYLVRSIVND